MIKKLATFLFLQSFIFDIHATDNEAFRDQITKADNCMRQTREVTPDQDCYPKTSWNKTSPSEKKNGHYVKHSNLKIEGAFTVTKLINDQLKSNLFYINKLQML
jgi:hypothetical protein